GGGGPPPRPAAPPGGGARPPPPRAGPPPPRGAGPAPRRGPPPPPPERRGGTGEGVDPAAVVGHRGPSLGGRLEQPLGVGKPRLLRLELADLPGPDRRGLDLADLVVEQVDLTLAISGLHVERGQLLGHL